MNILTVSVSFRHSNAVEQLTVVLQAAFGADMSCEITTITVTKRESYLLKWFFIAVF